MADGLGSIPEEGLLPSRVFSKTCHRIVLPKSSVATIPVSLNGSNLAAANQLYGGAGIPATKAHLCGMVIPISNPPIGE